jgi:hypothetical protein
VNRPRRNPSRLPPPSSWLWLSISYSESALKRREVARAKERDRDSRRAPLVVLWKSIDGFDMDHFERVGKRFTRQVMLDNLPEFAGVKRGAALTVKPNEELRRKIRLFKDIQATREAAFEFIGKGKYGGEDVPLRVGLGGLQDFTATVKTPISAPKAMRRGGHTRRPPGLCSRSSRFSMSTAITYP